MKEIRTTLEKDGFIGTFYEGKKYRNFTLIYVGGTTEDRACVEDRAGKINRREGFSVLALGYYLWDGLSKYNYAIPIDYCEKAAWWLKNKCPVEIKGIAMAGISMGALYTAVCASMLPDITCAVVISGFDYITEGIKNMLFHQRCSMFTWHGEDLPFSSAPCMEHVPSTLWRFVRDKNYTLTQINRFYYKDCFDHYTEESRVRVENIKGPVLLLAPGFDDTWPSEIASRRMEKVLKEKGFPYPYECVIYEKASHGLAMDMRCHSQEERKQLQRTQRLLSMLMTAEKKYPEECARARQDSYFKMVEFLKEWAGL